MKKLGLLVMALAAVAVLGTAAYAAVAPAPKAKLMTVKGTITAVDQKAGTLSLKEEGAAVETTFMVSVKLAKALKVGENVVVSYKTMASGENHAVYVKKEVVKKVKKAAPKK